MKKICFVLSCFLLCGCVSTATSVSSYDENTITNTVVLDSEKTDLSAYEWVDEEVADFEETSVRESLKLIEQGGSGIVYYGYVGCPWCERALPELNKVALKYGVTVYDVDPYNGTSEDDYNQFIELYGDALETDEDTGEKVFMVPLVVGIKDGVIKGAHTSLVDDFELNDDQDNQMSDAQKEELQSIYEQIILSCMD